MPEPPLPSVNSDNFTLLFLNEFATGGLLFWKNNTSTVGIGLQFTYRRTLNEQIKAAGGLSFVQSVPSWQVDAGYSVHSGILAELGVQVSPLIKRFLAS